MQYTTACNKKFSQQKEKTNMKKWNMPAITEICFVETNNGTQPSESLDIWFNNEKGKWENTYTQES
jgi:hypothetical protein